MTKVREVTEARAARYISPTMPAGSACAKVMEQNGKLLNERIYVGGFEIYRKYNGKDTTPVLERESLHIMDDKQRIMLVETRTLPTEPDPNRSDTTHPLPVWQPSRLGQPGAGPQHRSFPMRNTTPTAAPRIRRGAADRDAEALPLHRQGAG